MTRVTTKPASARSVTWHPVDRIILSYCLLIVFAIVLLGRPLSEYVDELLFYLVIAAITILVVSFVDETSDRTRAFFRILYPAFLAPFLYRATEGHMFLLFNHFFDNQVVGWEKFLLGEEVTLYLDRHLLHAWITESLSFCYFCYYLILPGFLILTFVRRQNKIIREYTAAACLTFFASYILFWLYPVEGPRWYLAGEYVNPLEGSLFRKLVEFIIAKAAVHGGAMPSSHTGVALVTLIFCFRYYRRLAWWLLPVVTGLAMGTFWGRFHYMSDTVIGALIGVVAVWVVWKYIDRPVEPRAAVGVSSIARTQNVP